MLEDASYTFGKEAIPDIMKNEGWDSPETVELSYCSYAFKDNEDKFDALKIKNLGKPFAEILDLVAKLRHTAVHRLPVTAATVEQFLSAAERFASLIGNDVCSQEIWRYRTEAVSAIEELTRNKDLLVIRHNEKLSAIAAQRAELDRLEKEAADDLLKEDQEYQSIAGANWERAISESSATTVTLAQIIHSKPCSLHRGHFRGLSPI